MFSRADASKVIRSLCGNDATERLVDAVYDGTEGWIQGIKLRAQAIKRNERLGIDTPVNGKNDRIRDYFFCGVLGELAPRHSAHLIRISLFERVSRSLLSSVFPEDDATKILDELLESNALILNCDYESEWYRFHPMFLDVLRHELPTLDTSELREICLDASKWFHENGYVNEAAKYLCMSGDLDYVEGLVETTSGLVRPDKSADSLMWMCRVPAASIPDSPFLCLMVTWSCVTCARLEDADFWMDRFRRLVEGGSVADEISSEAGTFTIKCLSMKYLAMRGEGERALCLCEELLNEVQPTSSSLLSMINQSQGEAYSSIGDYDQAMEHYLKAQASASVSKTTHQLVYNEYSYAMNLYYFGEHDKARQSCEYLIERCPPDFSIYGATCALLARVLIERVEMARVSELLDISNQGLSYYRHVDLYLDIMTSRAMWYLGKGDSSRAFETITEAVLQGERYRDVPREALLSAYFLQAQIALHRGDLNEIQLIERKFALHLKERDVFGALLLDAIRAFALGLRGDDVGEVALLDGMIARAREYGFNRMVVIALVRKTIAHDGLGEKAKAIMALNELIAHARPRGYMSTILSGGKPMKRLLREYATTRQLGGALRAYVKEILSHFEGDDLDDYEVHDKNVTLLQGEYALSAREVEVLRLLNMGLSRTEIAEELSISINTVKNHLSNIYVKMGVRNKSEALELIVRDTAVFERGTSL